jgi:hypothetical protein
VLRRRGATLAEALVALVLASVVLGSATGSVLRQRRTSDALRTSADAAAQLRSATGLLSSSLGLGELASGDLVADELRDTALQLRTTIAAGVACDTEPDLRFAIPADTLTTSGIASPPRAGDSAWWYRADSADWRGASILEVTTDSLPCASVGIGPPARAALLRLRTSVPGHRAGAPVRISRQLRWSLYRAGDGSWQLGMRESTGVLRALSPLQPVAGPFERTAADGAQSGFRYFDADGVELLPPLDTTTRARVARIRFTALAPSAPRASATSIAARDSVDLAVRRGSTP